MVSRGRRAASGVSREVRASQSPASLGASPWSPSAPQLSPSLPAAGCGGSVSYCRPALCLPVFPCSPAARCKRDNTQHGTQTLMHARPAASCSLASERLLLPPPPSGLSHASSCPGALPPQGKSRFNTHEHNTVYTLDRPVFSPSPSVAHTHRRRLESAWEGVHKAPRYTVSHLSRTRHDNAGPVFQMVHFLPWSHSHTVAGTLASTCSRPHLPCTLGVL